MLPGLPRSGTTLARFLQQHPDIASRSEPLAVVALAAFGRVDPRHPAGMPLMLAGTSELTTMVSRLFADPAYGQYLVAAGIRQSNGCSAHRGYREV